MIGAGPARTGHGYVRKARYFWERLCKGDVIVVEVCAYNVRCLSVAGNNPCFASEITANGKQIADSSDFQCYRLTDRKQKVLRYSFQRAFVESYDMQQCRTALYKGDASAYPSMLTETVASRTDYAELYNTLMQEFGYGRKEDEYPKVYPSNALIGFLLRLDLLRQDKQYEKLLNEVKAYYTKMAMMTGTLWEHKDTRASLNHGFASYVATFILEALGFIVPIF